VQVETASSEVAPIRRQRPVKRLFGAGKGGKLGPEAEKATFA